VSTVSKRKGKRRLPFAEIGRVKEAFYRSLPRSMRYTVESLEPRYLLSGAPTPSANPTQLTSHAASTNATNAPIVASELKSIIGALSYLGQQLDKDTMLQSTPVPLINQTMNSLAEQSSPGSKEATLGGLLFSDSTVLSTLQNTITTDFASTTTNVTSGTLAADLQTDLQGFFGTGYTVTDHNSTATELDLTFSYTATDSNLTTPLVLGASAQQFNLSIANNDGSTPTAKLSNTTTVSFDITADYNTSTTAPSDATSVPSALATYDASQQHTSDQQALYTDLNSDFTFTPGTIEQSDLIAQETGTQNLSTGALADFDIGFGIIGAASTATPDGGYSDGATFDLDAELQATFASGAYSLTTLVSDGTGETTTVAGENAPPTATSAYTQSDSFLSVTAPGASAVTGSNAFVNEATLTLPVNIYDGGQSISNPTPANDPTFISNLGTESGTFTISDANLFSGLTPVVNADSVELASFARLTPTDIIGMAQNSAYLAGQIDNSQLTADLPFLNLTQGDAYDFQLALQNAFVNALEQTNIVLNAQNEPSTSGSPTDLSGGATFTLGVGVNGDTGSYVLVNGQTNASQNGLYQLTGYDSTTGTWTMTQVSAIGAIAGGTAYEVQKGTSEGEYYQTSGTAATQFTQVLTATNATDVMAVTSSNLTYHSGGTITFTGALDGYTPVATVLQSFTVTLPGGATSMTSLVTELNAALSTALTAHGLSSTLVRAQLQYNSADTQIIQLYSTNANAQFNLSSFGGTLNLGFNQYNTVAAQGPDITGTGATAFQLPGVVVQSENSSGVATAINLSEFTSPVSFDVAVNGATAVTVTIPAGVYTAQDSGAFIVAVQNALVAAGLWDGSSQNGVLVQSVPVGGGIGIEFYGGNDVYSLQFSDPGPVTLPGTTTAIPSNFSALGLSASHLSSTAPYFTIATTNGATSVVTTTTVHVNGNITNGLLNDEQANQSVSDLVADLQSAINQYLGTGSNAINVSFGTDPNTGDPVLEFTAQNPGRTSTTISGFTVTNGSGMSALLGSSGLSSMNLAVAQSLTTPAFQTVEQLAALLYNQTYSSAGTSGNYGGVLNSAPVFEAGNLAGGGSPSFTFPINLSVDNTSKLDGAAVLPQLNDIALAFNSLYGDVSNLQSSSAVSIDRADQMIFNFGFNLIAPAAGANPIVSVEVPVTSTAPNFFLQTAGTLQITPDTGVTYTLNIPASTGNGTFSITTLLAALNSAIATATPSSGNTPLSDYLSSITSVTDATGQVNLVFNLVSGSTTALTVVTPPGSTNSLATQVGLSGQSMSYASSVLVASLPVTQEFTDYTLDTDAIFQFTVDNGTIYTVTIPAGSTNATNFLAQLNAAIGTATSNTGTSTPLTHYLAPVTESTNSSGNTVLNFVTKANTTRELTVSVPANSDSTTPENNAAWYDLGFSAGGSSATFTSNGTGSIGDYVLVTGQTNAAQNGLYTLTNYAPPLTTTDPAGGTWTLTPATTAIALTGSNLTYSNGVITFTGAIGGYTPTAGDIGSFVLVNGQTNTAQNGLYELTAAGTLTQISAASTIAGGTTYLVTSGTSASTYFDIAAGGGSSFTQIGTVSVPPTLLATSTTNQAYNSTTNTITFSGTIGGVTPVPDKVTSPNIVGANANGTDASGNAFTLSNVAYIQFSLPDGTNATLEIDPTDTTGDTTIQELVNTINTDIMGTAALKGSSYVALQNGGAAASSYALNTLPKVIAAVAPNGQSIEFILNAGVNGVYQKGATFSVTVQKQYLMANPNGAVVNLGLPTSTVADSTLPSLGMLSNALTDADVTGLGTSDSFQVSIDGQNYQTVNVDLSGVTTVAGLVQAINTGIAAVSVSFTTTGEPSNGHSFALSDYLQAAVTNGGTQVILRLLDDGVVNNYGSTGNNQFPVLENAAIVLPNLGTGVQSPLEKIGFSNLEQLFTLQGADGTISAVTFKGTATAISAAGNGAPFSGTAAFGFTDFNIGAGVLDEQATTNITFASGVTPSINDLLADANAGNFVSSEFGGSIIATPGLSLASQASYAVITLGALSFPASSVGGLTFANDATITFGYGTYNSVVYSGAITSFLVLPDMASPIYFDTDDLQLLYRLDLGSVADSLMRIGDLISDWMQNTANPVPDLFSNKLFFAQDSLIQVDNVGQDFANALAQVVTQPPTSLETTPAAIAQALQLDPSAITFNVVSSGGNVALDISFNWVKTVIETLPLSIDFATLANDSDNATYQANGQLGNYSTGVVNQFLLNLATVAGIPGENLNVNFSEVSQLDVNESIAVASGGVAIQPQASISNPGSGDFFQTSFLLDGSGLSGNLPAGSNYLQLNGGSVALDGGTVNGTQMPVLTVSDSNLSYSAGTITGTGEINGYSPFTSDLGGDILINGQTNTAQNGLYSLSGYNTASHAWTLTEVTPIASLPTTDFYSVLQGNLANANFGLVSGATQFNQIVDVFNPVTTSVVALSNSNLTYDSTTNTISGMGAINGYTPTVNDIGNDVLVNGQTTASQNGLYSFTAYDTTTNTWTLTQDTAVSAMTPETRFLVENGPGGIGYPANQYFGLAAYGATDFIPVAPLAFDTLAASVADPTTLSVIAATSAPLTALSGTGALVIDGYTIPTADSGGLVLVNTQTNPTQNGLYTVTFSAGNHWSLTPAASVNTTTRLSIQNGNTYANSYFGYYTPNYYAQLIEPSVYSYDLSGTQILPYTVDVATTSDLGSSVTFAPGGQGALATLTGPADTSINDFTTTASVDGTTDQFQGIDDVQSLSVGSLVLVKDQTAENENGVYVVTSLGSSSPTSGNGAFVLTRADFASTATQLDTIRIAVAGGYVNVGTRWVQTNASIAVVDSSNIGFTDQANSVYSNPNSGITGGVTDWLTFSARGEAEANLPLSIVVVSTTGTEYVIGNDLQNAARDVTIGELTAFYEALNGSNVTLATLPVIPSGSIGGPLVYSDFSPFTPLMFQFNLANFYAKNGSQAVHFTNVPDLFDSYVSTSVLAQLQNGFYIGDALDLALFTLQSSIAEALAQEFPLVGTSLAEEADFVENFRAGFTTLVRQNILSDPNTPLEDIRSAIYEAATTEGLLANFIPASGPTSTVLSESSILVEVWDGSSATAFPFGDDTTTNFNPLFYKLNPDGTYSEQVPSTTTAITFAFRLSEDFESSYTVQLNEVDLGDSALGTTISTTTANINTGTANPDGGGVTLLRSFNLNFGFGVVTNAGFFIYNPTDNQPTPVAPTHAGDPSVPALLADQNMVDFGFMAELNGNVDSTTITPFFQNTYSSQINNLSVEVADGRLLDQLDNPGSADDYLPSGFYGDAILNLNDNHPAGGANAGSPTLSLLGGYYADVNDLRILAELGSDAAPGSTTPAGSIFNYAINADADIDLQIQSQQQGLLPASEADMIYAKTYGTGASPNFHLNFENPAVIGLGNVTLGNDAIMYAGDPTNTTYQSDFTAIATQVSPIWRFVDRDVGNSTVAGGNSLLLANGAAGNTFVEFVNIKINIIDYLGTIVYGALRIYEDVIEPLRPYITFLTTPIPGTTAFTSGGITVGSLLGSSFDDFITAVSDIDNLISPLSELAASNTGGDAGWVAAPVTPLDLSGLFTAADYLANKAIDKATEKDEEDPENEKDKEAENETESPTKKTGVSEDTSEASEMERASDASADEADAGSETSDDSFESKSGDSASKPSSSKEEGGEEDEEEDKGKGETSVGFSGGSILLDAIDYNTLTNVYLGVNTNLLRVQLPELSVSYTYTKKFIVEPFPPLVITLSFTIGFDVNVNFGWDTSGFFFNTVDLTTGDPLPLFDFYGKFQIGIGLDFGLVDVEADVYFEAKVNFFWNDVSGTGKIHESDLQYLINNNDSIFKVEIIGTVGFDFSIVLSIPIPLIGPINITIFSYSVSATLFDVTFGAVTGQVQLGTLETDANGANDVLLLNSGIYAAQRLFVNTSSVNEDFTLYDVGGSAAAGENILVDFDNQYYQEFTGIKQVIGYTGTGSSTLDAGATQAVGSSGVTFTMVDGSSQTFYSLTPLQYAVVDFFAGDGDAVLRAGASYVSAWGRSRLQGNSGTGTELLEANTVGGLSDPGVDIIAGGGPATIYGSAGVDDIVAGQGPDLIYAGSDSHIYFATGFGNDRIYVTGGDNSVSFDGFNLSTGDASMASSISSGSVIDEDPLLTSAEISEFLPNVSVAPISTPLTLSFGPLVESAVTGDSTVFFATDPAEIQQINDWTGGIGGDTWNIYYFAPGQDLTLHEPLQTGTAKVNTFNVFFGNPNIVYVAGGAGNDGTINIDDRNSADVLDVTQTFPETVDNAAGAAGYDRQYLNGREFLNYDSQMLINYSAPNSVVDLGTPGATTFVDYNIGSYNVGTINFVSPVEFTSSNVTLDVKNTITLSYDLNMIGSATNPATLTINVTNAFPTGESDFIIASGAVLSISAASQEGKNSSPADGYGTICLNLPNGVLENASGTTGTPGYISLINGLVAVSAKRGIGSDNDIFEIIASQLAAEATGNSGEDGIYIQSPDSLMLTAYQNINGLTTTAGDIFVELTGSGTTLSYFQISAGSLGLLGGNVTIIADNIQPLTSFDVTRDVLTKVPIIQQVVELVPTFTIFDSSINLSFGEFSFLSLFFPIFFSFSVQVTNVVTGYSEEEVPTTVSVGGIGGPNGDNITGTGKLNLWNATNDLNILVGGTGAAPANTMRLSSALIDTISTTFASLVIGRASNDPDNIFTGNISFDTSASTYTFAQASTILIQGSSLDLPESILNTHVSSPNIPDSALQFISYGTSSTPGPLDGHIHFNAAATYAAKVITVSAPGVLNLIGTFEAYDPSLTPSQQSAVSNPLVGTIEVTTSGVLTVGGTTAATTLDASVGLSSIILSGSGIVFNSTASVDAGDLLTLTATAGMIADASGDTRRITGGSLGLTATQGISLYTDSPLLNYATTTNGAIAIDNSIGTNGALQVNSMTTGTSLIAGGNITLTNAGSINLFRATNNSAPLISTGASTAAIVQLTSTSGAIVGDTTLNSGAFDILTNTLGLTANGAIDGAVLSTNNNSFSLITQVSSLAAASATNGVISIINSGALTLTNAQTHAGAISIADTDSITVEGTVSTNNDGMTPNTAATISLDTHSLLANRGNINVGGNEIMGTLDAGGAQVTLTADNAILGAASLNQVSGSHVFATAYDDTPAPAPTDDAIVLNLNTPIIDAVTNNKGMIVLQADQSMLLNKVISQASDITVTGPAVGTSPTVNLTTYEVNAGSGNVHLTTSGAILDDTTDQASLNDITGATLYAQSVGTTVLKTDINDLDAQVGGTGSLTVNQDAGFTVDQAITNDGAININAGQANSVSNLVDGFVNVGTITAGMTSAINIDAIGGYIADTTFGQMTDTSLLTGGAFTATTVKGIQGLNTAITQLDATATDPTAYMTIHQTGDIDIDDVDMTTGPFTLTASPSQSGVGTGIGTITVNDITTDMNSAAVSLTSYSSAIEQQMGKITAAQLNATAHTGITALTDVGYLNATIDALGQGDIDVTQDSNLEIGQVQTPMGNFNLDLLSGGVTASNQALVLPYNVEASDIDITAPTGVATMAQNLNVYADSLDVTSTSPLGTGIFVTNYKDHTGSDNFVADDIQAQTGPVSITSAGNLLAQDIGVQADAMGNDIDLTSTDMGNVIINFVGTGLVDSVIGTTAPNFGDVNIVSAGFINAVDPANSLYYYPAGSMDPVNIVAYGVTFDAQTGIGVPSNLTPILTGTLLSAKTTTGDISTGESSAGPFRISGFSTGDGNLGFIKGGGGPLYATGFSTLMGNVNLTVEDGATLFLGTVFAIGNVSLQMDHISFQGLPGSVFGTGDLTIQPDNPQQYVQIGALFAQSPYESSNTLEIGLAGFEAFLTDFQSIYIGNLSNPNLTYVYYDTQDAYLTSSGGLNTTITVTQVTGNPPPGEFQLADLFANLATQASQGQLTVADIQAVLDELNLSGDFGSGSSDDSGNSDDDSFSDSNSVTPSKEAVTETTPSNHSSPSAWVHSDAQEQAANSSVEDDYAWIDRAVVVTAATVVATKPLRRFGGFF